MIKPSILLLLVIGVLSQAGSIQITPNVPTLYASSTYLVSYYTFYNMPSSATFLLNFTRTYITIPNGNLTITATVASVAVSGANASCSNSICTLKLNKNVVANTNIQFTIGNFTNPYFIQPQTITANVTFNSSYFQAANWTIVQTLYAPMPIKSNQMTQSDYGVGNTNVTYTFNFTVPMTPATLQLSVNIPSQVAFGSIQTSLIFYGVNQFVIPIIVNNIMIFTLSVAATNQTNPNGYIFLSITGLVNPQSIGSSSSFIIQTLLPNIPGTSNSCTGCIIAQISTSLLAQSTVPGNIQTVDIFSSNPQINAANNLTIYTQLYASIPNGGMYQILLPSSITPILPILCNNGYGFSLINGQIPICSYNSTNNAIYTNNFIFSGSGSVVITIQINNPPDTRQVKYYFQTFDANGNMIGNSTNGFSVSSTPLTLSSSVSKTNIQVESIYRLNVNATLQVALKTTDLIKVILPQANYNVSNLISSAFGVTLPYTTSIDQMSGNLTITMSPPCSPCSIGTNIIFYIDGLTNPSFINTYTQSIIVLTAYSTGIVQRSVQSVALSPSTMTVSNYSRSGSNIVGTTYSLTFNFNIPNYINLNGGQLVINFNQYDTYVNPIYDTSSNTYSYPNYVTVVDSQNNSYSNSISFYSANNPNSLQQIVIQMCGGTPCSTSLTIQGLRKGFNPLISMSQTVQITTAFEELVSSTTFSVMSYNVIKSTQVLLMKLSNSVTTQSSNYFIDFISNLTPFQSGVVFSFSSLHTINGGCIVQKNSTLFTGVFNCQVLNSSSINITYTGDPTLMMIDNIDYTITIVNVTNPISVAPLQYLLSTQFNGAVNQLFSLTYSIQNPLSLSLVYSKTNNTFGQNAVMNISVVSSFPSFDQVRVNAPSGLLTVLSSSSYVSTLTNNIYQLTGIYSLSNNCVTFNIVNPTSTNASGNISLSMYSSGYLSASGNVAIGTVSPMYLGMSASVSSTTVGATSNLIVTFNRVNSYPSESQFYLNFSSSLFNYASALYNNSPLVLPLVVPIGVTTITITKLGNLLFIPNTIPLNSISAWSVDSLGNLVSVTSFIPSLLVPNTPVAGLSYSFIRTNTAINGVGAVIINYTPQFPSSTSIMSIAMPVNQTNIITTTCTMQSASNGATNCLVLSSNSSLMTIQYYNQTTTTLTNVINVEPNGNPLVISMFTANKELVESSSQAITPSIQYNQLGITGSSTSTIVATSTQLKFNISTPNQIDIGSKIVINIPDQTFSRIALLTSQDCVYTVGGITYNGCQYGMNGVWVKQVNITYLGPNALLVNSNIILTLFLTNGWVSTPFGQSTVTFLVDNPTGNYVSQGTILLVNLYAGMSSLTTASINNLAVSQTSVISNTNNTVSISFILSIPLPLNSNIFLSIPKSTYTFAALNQSISNFGISSVTSNSTYYNIFLSLPCSQSSLICNLANIQYTFSLYLQNNPFVQIQQNLPMMQVLVNSNPISSITNLAIPLYAPQSLTNPTITRTNNNAFMNTNISITLTNLALSSFAMIISPQSTSTGTLPLLTAPSFAGLSWTQPMVYSLNTSGFIIVNITGFSAANNKIVLNGNNNLLVGTSAEQYLITIMDSNFIYFYGTVTLPSTLIPYSSGIVLQRTNTVVGTLTNIYLSGSFPSNIPSMSVLFNGNSFGLNSQTFNISLGSIANSQNISDSTLIPIQVKSSDYVAYSNSLVITPSLTAQNLGSFVSFTLPSVANISQSLTINVKLSSTSVSYISVVVPAFFKNLTNCCIDVNCTQASILSCSYSQVGSENLVEIYTKGPQTITNISFVVIALDYQASFVNSSVIITTGLPTSSVSLTTSITLAALSISATLALQNSKVNQLNTYSLYIKPINRSGYLSITIPSFITSQLTSNSASTYSLSINGSVTQISLANAPNGCSIIIVPVTFNTSNISLLMSSITNPINNQPYSINVQQASDSAFNNIYGLSTLPIVMNQFDLITISSAIRSVTKVGVLTQLTLDITSPSYTDSLVINFPASQIFTTSACQVSVGNMPLACSVINSTSILTTSTAGSAEYVISGLSNQISYVSATAMNLIVANIGYPYARASTLTSTSTYITPRLTLGSINVSSIMSTSTVILSSTTLTYNITIENTNINGFIISYGPYYYILSSGVTCTINSLSVQCINLSNSSVYLPYSSPSQNTLTVVLGNVVNYIHPTNFTITSVQTQINNGSTTYSDVDFYYNDGNLLTSLQSATLPFRVILPFNYVQPNKVTFTIILDNLYPIISSISAMALNFTTQFSTCSSLSMPFSQTLKVTCAFTQSTTYKMSLSMYHQLFTANTLSTGTINMFIYPSPTNNCQNQMCDSCSVSNGQQYCFACRQGLYSNNGQCSDHCNSGLFPYAGTNICQPCSPTCSSCFGLYPNDCMSCANKQFVLNSGTCQATCPTGTYSYDSFCVDNPQCDSVSGCRLCSPTGFCYQCLPDYIGAPTCAYQNIMPQTVMVYLLAPIMLLSLISIIYVMVKCLGADTLLSQTIFSFSFVELFAWAFTIPIMPNTMIAMVLVSFLTLRIIISIVSYEIFYKKNMGQLSQMLIEEESQKQISKSQNKQKEEEKTELNNWKTKLVRFIAHFNGPDSYELLKSKISLPILSVNHSFAIQVIFMLNRWLVIFLMCYLLSIATVGDSVLMPLLTILYGGLLSLLRLLTWDKAKACLSRCRP